MLEQISTTVQILSFGSVREKDLEWGVSVTLTLQKSII